MSLFYKYKLAGKTYHDSQYTLYRGFSSLENSENSVLIKTIHPKLLKSAGTDWLKNEYHILTSVNIAGVIQPHSLENYQKNFALVLEDFPGQDFARFLSNQSLTLDLFFKIALGLTNILEELDAHHIIHRNIQPNSIFIDPTTLKVKLTNFIISSRQDRPANSDLQEMEAVNISYISPEQTGRMKVALDYRTDFYSLGIIFYQLLTGELPFCTQDLLEIIHFHLAQTPVPPHQLDFNIPEAVSQVVMKLLAKNPDDRYQSAVAIKAALSICQAQHQNQGEIKTFSLEKLEKYSQFKISTKLYGRSLVIDALQSICQKVFAGATEMVVVKGDSGLGKTALVNHVAQAIVKQKGYFVTGKYEKLTNTTPYGAIVQAFGNLVQQLLTEGAAQLQVWQEKILFAVGQNGKVITNILPEIELVIGSQPDLPELPVKETHNRFNTTLIKFIEVFTRAEHPLILFLDDLQWCDSASLNLLKLLLDNPSIHYFLVIVAYRENEVDQRHELITSLGEIEQNSVLEYLRLEPLTPEHVNNLLVDTLHCQGQESVTLAELLHQLTQGNPFFLKHVLQTLYHEKILNFNFDCCQWQWQISEIYAAGINNYDVLDLIIANVEQLSPSAQKVLKLAACIGNQFESSTLAIAKLAEGIADGENQATIAHALEHAVQIGVIFQAKDRSSCYQFAHSRVQQAVYDLINEAEKEYLHLKIGQFLLNQTKPAEIEPNIFSLINHWNIAQKLVLADGASYLLAELNLIAGKKAKASIAYVVAANYLNMAMESLASAAWKENYELISEIYLETIEVQYLLTNFSRAEQLSNIILTQVETVLEKVRVYQTKIHAHIAQNQMDLAIEIGLYVLQLLEISFSDTNPNLSERESKSVLLSTSEDIQQLKTLPEMVDPNKLAAMEILAIIIPPVYIVRPKLFPQIVAKMVEICQQSGNSKISAFAYGVYGLLLCAVGNIEIGYQLGQLAIELLTQFNAKEIESKVNFTFNTMIRHWREPAIATLEHFIEGIQSGIAVGDIEHACFHAKYYCTYSFFVGEPLPLAAQESQKQIEMIQNFKQDFQLNYVQVWRQLNLNLQGMAEDRLLLRGESFDEVSMLPFWLEMNNATSLFAFYLAKLILCYLLKDYEQAVVNGKKGEQYLSAAIGTMCFSVYHFYYPLAMLAICSKESNSEYLSQAKFYQQQMKHWAAHSANNYLHKYELLTAEIARISGEYQQAGDYYDQAIATATKAGYIQEAALASELAGEYYLAKNREKIAGLYLVDAYHGYRRWGAFAKVQNLKSRHGKLLFGNLLTESDISAVATAELNLSPAINSDALEFSSQKDNLATLDLFSVIKASQAISSEIILDNLLAKMMEIVLENAGAQKSVLFLEENSRLTVAACATITPEKKVDLPHVSISEYSAIPNSIINYVQSTRKTLVLDRDNQANLFANDPYIIEYQPKSILGLPMIYKNELQGIVYLENSLIEGAFTSEKLDVLQVLLSQVSISIENARLYKNLEEHASVQKSLKQKEILLKEIHHRVKNNLLVVSSLLDMQTNYTDQPEIIKLLENCQNRVTSMALVHQHLYGSSELDKVDFAQYTESLLDHLAYSQNCEARNICLYLDLEKIELNIETANPCGLIINELVSNALEHGFRDRDRGNIWLKLNQNQENKITLAIKDDGVGFKTGLDLYNSDSLGLELVCTLVEQIEGTIKLDQTNGTKIEIVFEELNYEKRI
jgi:histidine kinase